ncbi:MAG: NAD(+) diphosphatase [Rickettsiales bacterium TMED289]|nr:NAD(+) diphosphatase [Gammaproteobacteria bacterium]MAJ89965.1 NAD(+) diphosphatase [Flavobacteriales bacterium]RPF74471.1 MAG: NAD(+) diphosphatase [Rickettsiales bacterium TMED289]
MMLHLYQSGAFPKKLLNNVLTNSLLNVYIILTMKRFTSSFSTKQTPKENDLIVSINESKKILFNKKEKSFIHNNLNSHIEDKVFEIFKVESNSVFLTGALNNNNEDLIYLSKRELYPYLNEESLMIVSRSFQLFDWIYKQNYCSRTGNKLSEIRDDLSKFCDSCPREYYPKMSPCILVILTHGTEILLVRHNSEIRTLYTAIAGFVDLGETLEECVEREVFEEVGLKINNINYVGSQSWPFPNQLMMAFQAEAISRDVQIDENEILEASWFKPNDLPKIPPEPSLSNQLIKKAISSLI